MADPFVGEIRLFPFYFAPKNWAFCDGQLLPLSQNTALFSLLGTYYGGNGKSNFALPDMRGRAPMAFGQGPGLSQRVLGEQLGSSSVTLLESEMPAHSHSLMASAASADRGNAGDALLAASQDALYASAPPNEALRADSLGVTGGSQPHNNMQPYLTLRFCIALQGVFPPRS